MTKYMYISTIRHARWFLGERSSRTETKVRLGPKTWTGCQRYVGLHFEIAILQQKIPKWESIRIFIDTNRWGMTLRTPIYELEFEKTVVKIFVPRTNASDHFFLGNMCCSSWKITMDTNIDRWVRLPKLYHLL